MNLVCWREICFHFLNIYFFQRTQCYKSWKEKVNASSAIKIWKPSMFRRRSHLSHFQWKNYNGYWLFNKEHDLVNINHKLYQRVSSFFYNEHKRTNNVLHYKKMNSILHYQLIIISIILQIILKLPGKQYPLFPLQSILILISKWIKCIS